MNGNWLRVNRHNPCQICGRPDWCMVSKDGTAAICPRVEAGCVKYLGEKGAGYLHRLGERRVPLVYEKTRHESGKVVDCAAIHATYSVHVSDGAAALGLLMGSLHRLDCRAARERVLAFPMQDGAGKIVGIRYRHHDGRKWSETGGHNGLFVPTDLWAETTLLVCEGPTDTAAMLGLGFDSIGRPSCTGAVEWTQQVCRGRRVVIVADSDGPGRDGAAKLADALWICCRWVRIISPPYMKDAREWVRNGATREEVEGVIGSAQIHSRRKPTKAGT